MELARKHSEVSLSELEVFDALKDIDVVFDVGARMEMDQSTVPNIFDYLELKPEATYHLFEPNPEYAKPLTKARDGRENVILNIIGLGDVDGYISYSNAHQAFSGGEAFNGIGELLLPVTTLDAYCTASKVPRIDLLKIDTEGYDYRVLLGAKDMLKNIHYIQYEEWNEKEKFYDLLEDRFDMKEIGFRNVLCTNKLWL